MLHGLKTALKKNKAVLSGIRKIKNATNKTVKFINLNILKYISPSSKLFGAPKHELWTWEDVEKYVVQKNSGKHKPFLKKLYEQQITFDSPIVTIGTPESGAELEPKINFDYCEYVCMFPNARISIRDFNIITEDDYLVQPLSNYYDKKPHSHIIYTKIKLPMREKLRGKTLLLKGFGHAYYHIIHDAVCAVKLVKEAGINLKSIDNFLIFDYNKEWYDKVYSKLDLPKEKFINGKSKNAYECEQLIIASYFEHHGIWYSDFLKETFLPKKTLKKNYGTKLFISRAKALTRRILNEDEVVTFLSKKGFAVIYAEDLTMEEQAQIYNAADCIVAIHGANLVNIMFCKPGTKICEIRYTKHIMYYKKLYYEMAQSCNLKYYLLYASEGKLSTTDDVFDSDIYVNIKDLDKMLSFMECETEINFSTIIK